MGASKTSFMFRDRILSHSGASDTLTSSTYGAKVRAAHELADMLKRNRPHLYDQVNELQTTINRCQCTLDQCKHQVERCAETNNARLHSRPAPSIPQEVHAALEELEVTTQALLDLRHKGQMAR